MKKLTLSLIALFFSITFFAQGIAVQGIARDNTNAAITNETLSFDFRILDAADAVLFRETQQIKTDNFGLFSHVVSTGTAADGTVFNNVDFSLQGLKLVVWISYNANNVKVYEQELQYVPYAHYAKKAANGVPPGTVVPFLGDDSKIPTGWIKAAGQNISSGNQYAALRAVIGNTIPDLRGRFLRGDHWGTVPRDKIDENVAVRTLLDQSIVSHGHNSGTLRTNGGGDHGHGNVLTGYYSSGINKRALTLKSDSTSGEVAAAGFYTNSGGNNPGANNLIGSMNSAHNHTIIGDTGNTGQEENRPWTVVVNYIIKL